MRHISLESGIGGFDYAAEMMNWENVAHCEINIFCQTVLKYYWPDAELFTDLFTMDGRKFRGTIDILTCGFPCQPFSVAGKGEGDKDDRFIWPENMRIIREVQPRYVVAENVPGILNIERGMVFERVCADLENEGYEVTPVIIPACAAQEDHIRERVFFIAYNHRYGHRAAYKSGEDTEAQGTNKGYENKRQRYRYEFGRVDKEDANITNFERFRFQGSWKHRRPGHTEENRNRQTNNTFNGGQLEESWVEAAARLCSVDDVAAGELDTFTLSKTKWRNESIKAYGNAVHWKVAYEIFKAIETTHP